jgi:hypothetical protein
MKTIQEWQQLQEDGFGDRAQINDQALAALKRFGVDAQDSSQPGYIRVDAMEMLQFLQTVGKWQIAKHSFPQT